MAAVPGLWSCTDVRKNDPPRAPGVDPTTGTTAAGSGEVGGSVAVPLACTDSVTFGLTLPLDPGTSEVTSDGNRMTPAAAPGDWPTGLPHEEMRAMPIRSPACTSTGGESGTKRRSDVTLYGPRSARRRNDPLGLARKNLSLTAAGHGAVDQLNAALVSVAATGAG